MQARVLKDKNILLKTSYRLMIMVEHKYQLLLDGHECVCVCFNFIL